MSFNSLHFLIFLPVVLLVYYIIPEKLKYLWLLFCSYYFYMSWNALYLLLILFSTVVTWGCGVLLDKIQRLNYEKKREIKLKKICVLVSMMLNLGILFFFKYFNFASTNLNIILKKFNFQLTFPVYDILLPVGISFYTFQALGYTIDVYRNETYAEKNIFRYALFVSFFPQLVAGPIERSKNLLKQLAVPAKFNFENVRDGILLMIWGFFLKLILADRIAVFVESIYGENGSGFEGCYLVVATVLFAVQIYCDFSGYSIIAMGAARTLGIELMENFDAPYLSQTVAEFWRRWHISLSGWFRDYLYIPLGGNRKGKMRRYINILITFSVSGLWHGAQWNYVAWGMLNGIYQVLGDVIRPLRNILIRIFGLNEDSIGHKVVRAAVTFIYIDFAWIFFRASCFQDALKKIKSIYSVYNPWILFDGSLYKCGLNQKDFHLMLFSILILLFADIAKYRGIKIRKVIAAQDYWCQAFVIAFSVLAILLFGIWGGTYDAARFIYFQF